MNRGATSFYCLRRSGGTPLTFFHSVETARREFVSLRVFLMSSGSRRGPLVSFPNRSGRRSFCKDTPPLRTRLIWEKPGHHHFHAERPTPPIAARAAVRRDPVLRCRHRAPIIGPRPVADSMSMSPSLSNHRMRAGDDARTDRPVHGAADVRNVPLRDEVQQLGLPFSSDVERVPEVDCHHHRYHATVLSRRRTPCPILLRQLWGWCEA